MVVAALVVPVLAQEQKPDAPPKDTKNRFLEEKGYVPKRGDRVSIAVWNPEQKTFIPGVGGESAQAYNEFLRTAAINDVDGMAEMTRDGSICVLPVATSVLVLDVVKSDLKEDLIPRAIIRVLEGEHKSKKLWTGVFAVKRLIPNPDYDPPPRDAAGDESPPAKMNDTAILFSADRRGKPMKVVCGRTLTAYLEYLERIQNKKPIGDMFPNRLVEVESDTKVRVDAVAGYKGSTQIFAVETRDKSRSRYYVLENFVKAVPRRDTAK